MWAWLQHTYRTLQKKCWKELVSSETSHQLSYKSVFPRSRGEQSSSWQVKIEDFFMTKTNNGRSIIIPILISALFEALESLFYPLIYCSLGTLHLDNFGNLWATCSAQIKLQLVKSHKSMAKKREMWVQGEIVSSTIFPRVWVVYQIPFGFNCNLVVVFRFATDPNNILTTTEISMASEIASLDNVGVDLNWLSCWGGLY